MVGFEFNNCSFNKKIGKQLIVGYILMIKNI